MLETTRIEFKREYNDKVNKVLLSFLNTEGGTLFIGIADDGAVCGVDDADAVMLRTMNSLRDSVTPDPSGYVSIAPIQRDGKTVIEVAVERGAMIPYCFKAYGLVPQGVYVRVGSESVSASREHIRQLIRENDSEKFIEALSLEQNLSFGYAAKIFDDNNVPFGEAQRQSLGLVRADGRYSNLALLLSDQCPYSIKAAIFQGVTKENFKDRKEFAGSVFKQINEVLAYLNVYNKVASTFEGAYRVDHPDYPEIVLREAVINAVIHRDYFIEGATLVSMFDDRLEIMSLGGILPGVTKEIMLAGVSVPRNEKLAAVFHRLKLIEAYGTGIPRIFEAYAKHGAKPDIPITNSAFLISLPNLGIASEIDETKAKSKISKSERRILSKFEGRSFTKQNAADLLEMSASGAYKLLARMAERGLLDSKRNGREMHYVCAH
ncbi:MAG: putative DNA binding domain-containing protein [Clostridiales bacterium]|jgi:ATP-dependent DNA helicase RecG|nr:putative DNA binding domain-containing protein [Clostridiales bacterium]